MGYHKAGYAVFGDDTCRQLKHLFCRSRIKSGSMFIEKQQLRCVECRHHESKCLALSAGKKSDRLAHTVLKSHIQECDTLAETFFVGFGKEAEPSSASRRKCKVFFNGHTGCASAHRVLKQTSDLLCTFILRFKRYVAAVEEYFAGVNREVTCYRSEKS